MLEQVVGLQAVLDEIARLRSAMKQLVAVQPTPFTGMLDSEFQSKEQKTIKELQRVNAQQ